MSRAAWVVLTALALPAPLACAGMFDDKEARTRIEQLRTDLDGLSTRVDRAGKNQIDFVNDVEALKTEIARIRGQIEILLNDVDSTQKRQRDFYIDLDNRLRKLETAATPVAESANKAASVDPAQEGRDYEAALALFKAAKYKESAAAFMSFAKAWPDSSLLPNAHYWAASSQYQMHDYQKAADMFAKVASNWPDDPKAADALLAQGNALTEAGDSKGARKVLQSLVTQYPSSTAAQAAKQRLKKK